MTYTPPGIRDIGLEPYLNARKKEHNGMGYADLCKQMQADVSTAAISRLFKVSRQTAFKWVKIFKEEQLGGQTKSNQDTSQAIELKEL